PYYPPADKRANLAGLLDRRGFRLVEGDLATMPLQRHLAGAAAGVQEAAQPGGRTSWGRGFAPYLRHNVLATQRLLEACVRAEVPRLVAAPSASVDGGAPTSPTRGGESPQPQ